MCVHCTEGEAEEEVGGGGEKKKTLQKCFKTSPRCVLRCDEGAPVMKYGSLCFSSFCKAEEEECFSKENLLLSLSYDMAAKKRKKDLMNNNTKVPCESPAESCTVGLAEDKMSSCARLIIE